MYKCINCNLIFIDKIGCRIKLEPS